MTVNLKEEIDRNIADMVARYSPAKPAAPPAPAPGSAPSQAAVQSPEIITAQQQQTQPVSFFGRLWKAIFGK